MTLRELTPPTQADLLPEHRGRSQAAGGAHGRWGQKPEEPMRESFDDDVIFFNYRCILILNIRH